MLTNRQKGLIQKYKKAADLSDFEYRKILFAIAGVQSSTHKRFNQRGFEMVMARLEEVLEEKIHNWEVEATIKIADLTYWRDRLPPSGAINSRQKQRIQELWNELSPYLDDKQRSLDYATAIASKACKHRVASFAELTATQAQLVIEAFKDRLHYAAKQPKGA